MTTTRIPGVRFRRLMTVAALAQIGAGPTGGAEPDSAAPMTQAGLETLVKALAAEASGRPGWLRFVYDGVPMACVSDVAADRMRITAPISRLGEITGQQLITAMEANFHTVLDVRYATSDGILHAVYVHPLSPLTPAQVESAVRQVASASKTFGTTYSSGTHIFGGDRPQPAQPDSGTGT